MSNPQKKNIKLHVEGVILGYKRALRTQNNAINLVKIKGCDSTKKVAFVTQGQAGDYRVNWGKVQRSHGSNGVVRCAFRRNLPPQAIGGKVRVMLFPSRI
jgi:large subunit ribosomal protein L35Ae